jgi:hypothetical protein
MADSEPQAPIERFKPTGGMLIGWLSLAVAIVLLVLVPVSEPNLTGVRVVLVVALIALVVWMALLRPRATVYPRTLVLRNMVSDTHLPLAGIDAVLVRTTLNVWVEEERYVCIGIGRPTRKLVGQKGGGPMSVLGLEHDDRRYGMGQSNEIGGTKDYAGFVEDRIAALALAARRDLREELPPVRRKPAVPELVALGVLVGALVVSFLL